LLISFCSSLDHGLLYGFLWDERRSNNETPTMIRITGQPSAIILPRGGSMPRFERKKMMPKAIRIYAPTKDFDFITPPLRIYLILKKQV
jgi:hypothetical protein